MAENKFLKDYISLVSGSQIGHWFKEVLFQIDEKKLMIYVKILIIFYSRYSALHQLIVNIRVNLI